MEQNPTHLVVKKTHLLAIVGVIFLILGVGIYYLEQTQKALVAQQLEIKNVANQASSSIAITQQQNEKLARTQSELATEKAKAQQLASTKIQSSPAQTKLSNSQIIAKVKPAVVYIETSSGEGSGMIISSDGYILTNAHVVLGVSIVKVTLSTNTYYFAQVIGRDEYTDIAVLKIPAANLPTVILGDSDAVGPGDSVFALGFPFGLTGEVSFTSGVVSRRYTEGGGTYIQNTAEIFHGNSGGPLVNSLGQVIGINSYGYTPSVVGSFQLGETIKFAIPINVAKSQIPVLESGLSLTKQVATPAASYSPAPTPAPQDDKTIGENYYKTNHTCVGLNGEQYSYCISYAYNH